LTGKKIHQTVWEKLRNYSMTFNKTLSKNIIQFKTIHYTSYLVHNPMGILPVDVPIKIHKYTKISKICALQIIYIFSILLMPSIFTRIKTKNIVIFDVWYCRTDFSPSCRVEL